MRRHLQPPDVATLLAAPKCATLATYRRDGTLPRLEPGELRIWDFVDECGENN